MYNFILQTRILPNAANFILYYKLCLYPKLDERCLFIVLHYYWTVRYAPDPVRPTSVGVGVIVSCQSTLDVACKFISNPSDIVDIGGPQESMLESLKNIEKDINNIAASSKNIYTYIDRLIHHSNGILQFDNHRMASGSSSDEVVHELYNRMIA